ncbi:unnamed protein product [Euphydryas editha]|uniref:Uncharacterized protein n=1 Tax=Euphydryas editha TaxID=104508 RepID=A0AAU9TT67_EUPED|nr:unnamed protein product [Euphydryas editha]
MQFNLTSEIHLRVKKIPIILKVLLVLMSYVIANLENNREVMKAFSYTFGNKLFECSEKTILTQEMAKDILYFWDANRRLDNKETGCLIICAMVKLKLLNSDGELMVPNAKGYLQAAGADDNMAAHLIKMYKNCKSETSSTLNGCEIALEISKCFRRGVHQKNWTPDTSSLYKMN